MNHLLTSCETLTMNGNAQTLATILVALMVLNGSEGAAFQNQLKRLGSLVNINGFEESIYFTSQTPTNWKDAESLCINVLGNDASLVSIETEPELAHIRQLLISSNNKMASFWTAGKFEDGGRKLFSWGAGEVLESWIWAENEPSQQTEGTRLAMRKNGDGNWNASTVAEQERHGFICEITPGSSAEPVPCYNRNDLIVALDSSGSIGPDNYTQAKDEFVNQLATAWTGWEYAEIRISFIIYSDESRHIFRLDNRLTAYEIEAEILKAPYLSSGTNSHLALQMAFQDFELFERDVTRNLVFLTDGQSNNPDLTREQAANLHGAEVRVFAVGIGENVVQEELESIASDIKFVFKPTSFAELKNYLKPLTRVVCDD